MTYVISDIHGCYDKYQKLLHEICFGSQDTLYILGDVIDRGADGFKIFIDLIPRPNVVCLRGNHEDMAMQALPGLLRAVQSGKPSALTQKEAEAAGIWFYNGGEPSLVDFLLLNSAQKQAVWKYLQSMPLYQDVKIENRSFLLLHGGLEGFSPSRSLEDYTPDEILWSRPTPDTVYFSDKLTILGHTPSTILYAEAGQTVFPPRFFHSKTFLDIDCSCAHAGGRLGCLCLDTMEEVYV